MTTMRDTRPDRRPDWLKRKHRAEGTGPSDTDREVRGLTEQLLLQALEAGRPVRLTDAGAPLWEDEDEARDEGRLLYSTARRLGLSVACRTTDPATGKCELCAGGWSNGQRCQPSPRGGYDLHFAVFPKTDAYKYLLEHYGPNPDDWPYVPATGRNRRGQNDPGQPADQPGPPAGSRFGGRKTTPADPPPAQLSGRRAPPPPPKPQQPAAQPEPQESALEKLRRWAAG